MRKNHLIIDECFSKTKQNEEKTTTNLGRTSDDDENDDDYSKQPYTECVPFVLWSGTLLRI